MNKYLTIIATIIILVLGFWLYNQSQAPDSTQNASNAKSENQVAKSDKITLTTKNNASPETDSVIEAKLEEIVASQTETKPASEAPKEPPVKKMLIAGGCFWCVEADAEKLSGVVEAVSGYAEGSTENPTYRNYSKTGHREVVEVTYDTNRVTFSEVVINAIKHMDPTDANGSFGDRGDYYSPALYYENDAELKIINDIIERLDKNGPYDKPLALEVMARPKYWPAEDYHQDYYKGTLSAVKYKYYRNASARDTFIQKYWGSHTGPTLNF